eukprot:GHVS01081545.1.p1 GENE.GHVS01081545.1~~GHVS01081545.1.p1  ORF type:complete len:112 (-),score=9.63 GHVS01081545.1:21-356(-)
MTIRVVGGRPCLEASLEPVYGHVVVRLFLFDEVKNAEKLLESCSRRKADSVEELVSRRDEEPTLDPICVLINPQLVVSPFHVLQSIYRSLSNRDQNQMKTKCIETDVLYYL